MENTVNKLSILPFEQGDDTMGPCKIGFQKQPLKHVKKPRVSFGTKKKLRNGFKFVNKADLQNTTIFSFLWQTVSILKNSLLYCELPKQKLKTSNP